MRYGHQVDGFLRLMIVLLFFFVWFVGFSMVAVGHSDYCKAKTLFHGILILALCVFFFVFRGKIGSLDLEQGVIGLCQV